MEVDDKLLMEIKRVTLYFFFEFYEETKERETAIELTKEAMTTWRTIIISKERAKEHTNMITERQYKLLSDAMGNFEESQIVMDWLHKFGKNDISELTKDEAMKVISDIISGKKKHKPEE